MTASGASADEVTVVNVDSWIARTSQLAALLSRAAAGDVIPDALGNPADPRRVIALGGLTYWSQNSDALRGMLSAMVRSPDWPPAAPDLASGAIESGPERLTWTVEEAAATLGISRAFAYEAVRRGEIPSIRIGRRVLVPRAALERLLDGGSPTAAD